MKKVVTFRDYNQYSQIYEEDIIITAAQQLEDFLNDNFYDKIVSINYAVTHHGFNSAAIPIYRNYILLVYKEQ